jgi:hypothetical protein
MVTEMQVVVTAGIIVVVAVVSWCAAAWWCAGRYEEIITDREEEIDGLKEMLGWDQRLDAAVIQLAPEVAHEAWLAHEEQALAVANDQLPRMSSWQAAELNHDDLSVTAWTQAQAENMDAFIASMAGYGR